MFSQKDVSRAPLAERDANVGSAARPSKVVVLKYNKTKFIGKGMSCASLVIGTDC